MNGEFAGRSVRALALTGLIALVVAGAAGPVGARPSPGPTVDIHSASGLAPDGQSMTVQVLASCPERWTVVEAVVRVSQPQAAGQASFTFPCISSVRMFTVVVPSGGGTFQLGSAQATASVIIQRGRTQQAQDAEVLFVQPSVLADLADSAQLESGGGAVTIAVTVACPMGAIPQQSYVNVTQGLTTGNGFYVPVCDGSPHTFTVGVQASRGAYQAGGAQALTFANVEHEGIGFAGIDDQRVELVS
jgi:hypothetical protein